MNCETITNTTYRMTVDSLMPQGKPDFVAIASAGTGLASLRKSVGIHDVTVVMAAMLTKFCNSFNVVRNMTSDQIEDYALTLVLECAQNPEGGPALTLEDFAVFFEQCKTGRYVQPFDHIDAALIETWLDKYYHERNAQFQIQYEEYRRQVEDAKWNAQLQDPNFKPVSSDTIAATVQALTEANAARKIETEEQRAAREAAETERAERLEEKRLERARDFSKSYFGDELATVEQRIAEENRVKLERQKQEHEKAQRKEIP